MRIVSLVVVLVLSLFVVPARAQTVQQSGTAQWTQAELPAVASTLAFTLYNSTVITSPGVLTPAALPAVCVAAVAPATGSTCSAPLPANMNPSIGGNYALCARFPTGVAMACTDTIGNSVPGRPGGFKIVINVIFQ